MSRIPDISVAEFFIKHYVNCTVPQQLAKDIGLWDRPLVDAVSALAAGKGHWYWSVQLADAVLSEQDRRKLACLLLRWDGTSWCTPAQLRLIELGERNAPSPELQLAVREVLSENAQERARNLSYHSADLVLRDSRAVYLANSMARARAHDAVCVIKLVNSQVYSPGHSTTSDAVLARSQAVLAYNAKLLALIVGFLNDEPQSRLVGFLQGDSVVIQEMRKLGEAGPANESKEV